MRSFHLAWMAFFPCFFAWFACAPLMPAMKGESDLPADQLANIIIAAVAAAVLVRLFIRLSCDRHVSRHDAALLTSLNITA